MGPWLLALSAGGFWAGILLAGAADGRISSAAAVVTMGAAGCLLAACLAATGREESSAAWVPAGLLVSFALLGLGWAGLREARLRASPLATLAGRTVSVSGAMTSEPEEAMFGWTASLDADLVFPSDPASGGWRVRDPVWLQGRGPIPGVGPGDRVEVVGILDELHGSFGSHLRRRGYVATLRAESVRVRGPPTNPLLRAADALRSALRSSASRVLPDREAGLLLGLALGDASRADPDVTEDFRAAGLSHLTAVSGQNVAMFLAPILGLAAWVGVSRRVRFVVGVGAVAFFVLLTRAEPSVLRAAAMTGLTMLGVFLGRPRSPPAILGGAVVVLLAVNPGLVYAIGFQLSVGATAGMAVLAGPLAQRLGMLPNGLALAAATTLGAQAGVTPLLLYHFGVVPTVTLPANLLAFPVVGLAMLLGLFAAGVGLVWPPVGSFAGGLARLPLDYLIVLADRMARAPLPSVTSPGGRAGELVVGLAAVGAFGWWLRSGRRIARRAVVAAGLALALFVWAGALRAGPPGVLTVTFFDVGQGDAALVRSPGGSVALIDAGPDPDQVAGELSALGMRRLDLVIATHAHADHIAGLPAVLSRFPVSLVIDPGCPGDSPFYDAFVRSVASAGISFGHPRRGEVLTVGDLRVDVLGPLACHVGTSSDANNDSLVIRVSVGQAAVLFPGDVEEPAQAELLRATPQLLVAPVLKVPHHGGGTSLDTFLQATGATVAVVSVGRPNPYGHPDPDLLEDLAADGMRILRTDLVGDVTIRFLPDGLLIQSSDA